jgi:hypothetical protein
MEVKLAHELGHVVIARIPYARVPGIMNAFEIATEYSAFYYEDLAREAFGCGARFWNHDQVGPDCQ